MSAILNPVEIYIYGSGQVAEIIADYALQKNILIKAFIDDNIKKKQYKKYSINWIFWIKKMERISKQAYICCDWL